MNRILTICLLSTAVAAAGCNMNKDRTTSSSNVTASDHGGGNPALPVMDQHFLADAAAGGAYEVQSSRLALQKSNDTNLKQIANQMINDHTAANDKITLLARDKNMVIKTVPNDAQTAMINTLQSKQGSDFDREYLRQQKTAHEDTIAKFEAEARDGSGDAQKLAADTLPTLRSHLQMIDGAMTGNNNMNGMNMGTNR